MERKDQVLYVYRYHHWCLGIRTPAPYPDEDTDPSRAEGPGTSRRGSRTDPCRGVDGGSYQEEIHRGVRVDHGGDQEEGEDDIQVEEDLRDNHASGRK